VNLSPILRLTITETLGSNQHECIRNGMLLIDAIMNDVDVGNHSMGFFNYTTYISQFKLQLLEMIFFETQKMVSNCALIFLKGDNSVLEILSLSLQVLLKILCFPFEPSYASLNNENSLQDGCSVNYPQNWYILIRCPVLVSNLTLISCRSEWKLRSVCLSVLNMISSAKCETGVGGSKEQDILTIGLMGVLGGQVAEVESSQQLTAETLQWLDLLVDMCWRMLKHLKLSKMIRTDPQRFELWVAALLRLTKIIIHVSPQVGFFGLV
jgi:hypothetical protein